MYNIDTPIHEMSAEEVLAMHERAREEADKKRLIAQERQRVYDDRNAKIAAKIEAKRVAALADTPPPDPNVLAAQAIVVFLGDRFPAFMALFGGVEAEMVQRKLNLAWAAMRSAPDSHYAKLVRKDAAALADALAARSEYKARRRAELDAGAL